MSQRKSGKRSRSMEAKLFLTAASVAATVAGVSLFASNDASLLAETQSPAVAVAPQPDSSAVLPAPPSLPQTSDADDEEGQAPSAQPTATATPLPTTRGSRMGRSQPGALGTTRSSR